MDPTYKGLHVPTPMSTPQRKGSGNLKKGLVIGGVIIAGIILLGLAVNFLTPNNTGITQRMLYRIDALSTLTSSSRAFIKNGDLSKINTDLSIMLNGDNAELKKAVPVVKMTPELTAIKKEETDATTADKLKTATINGAFDTVYKTVLMQKLEAASQIIKDVYKETSSKTLKQTLTNTADHINTYYQQLKKLP